MRGFIKKAMGRTNNREGGFTLIELLVVIGIIVALAAITVPLVTKLAGKGDEGALKAETETVQSAMMADKGIVAVTANDKGTTSNGQNTWTALPAGTGADTLDNYLKKNKTKFFYCWDTKGNVYAQNKTDGVIAVPDDAKAAAACATPA